MKRLVYGLEASKALGRIPANVAALIGGKIRRYATDPKSLKNNVKSLKGEPGSRRLRVGDWRVVFLEDRDVITIVRIAPRGRAYD